MAECNECTRECGLRGRPLPPRRTTCHCGKPLYIVCDRGFQHSLDRVWDGGRDFDLSSTSEVCPSCYARAMAEESWESTDLSHWWKKDRIP